MFEKLKAHFKEEDKKMVAEALRVSSVIESRPKGRLAVAFWSIIALAGLLLLVLLRLRSS